MDEMTQEASEVINTAIKKAPKKYVGYFLIAVSMAIIIVAIGYACAKAFKTYEMNAKRSNGSEINLKIGQ